MQHIFANTLPIFLMTLVGVFIKRKWITSEEFWRGLEKLSYFLLFPCMLFSYVSEADLSSAGLIKIVLVLTVSTSIIAVGLIIYQRKHNSNKVLFTSTFQGSIRYNSYMLFGLSNALFGSESLSIVTVISTYMIVYTNLLSVTVFSIYIFNQAHQRTNMLLLLKLLASNPLILASLIGVIFNYYDIHLYIGIKKTILSFANSALAIGMINVGAGLKFVVNPVQVRQVIYASAVKLIALPLVTAIILSMMSIDGLLKSIAMLYSCLPCASTAYVLSRQLDGDPESMASIITFSTLLSIVTLSLIMYVLG